MDTYRIPTYNPYDPTEAPSAHQVLQAIIDRHQVYSGLSEGGYTWDCTCGAASDDVHADLDLATIEGTWHLHDVGAIPEEMLAA